MEERPGNKHLFRRGKKRKKKLKLQTWEEKDPVGGGSLSKKRKKWYTKGELKRKGHQ